MTDRALLQQALVVFEGAYRDVLMNDAIPTQKLLAIMDALRARLAQPAIDGFGGNLDSAFDAAPAPVVPDGWVMVPREPTIGMCIAGDGARHNADDATRTPAIYRAMVAAAPAVQPLTGDQLWDLWRRRGETPQFIDFIPIVRDVEQAHGIGTQGGEHG